jgi:hypothetical protein
MEDIKKKYLANRKKHKEKKEILERKITKLQKELSGLESYSWVDELVVPLAKKLSDRFKKEYEIYGPFGLRADTTIYLLDDPSKSITEQPVLRLSLIPKDLSQGELFYETGEQSNEYQKGSIGYLNGMNNVEKKLPDDFEEIVKLVK